MTYLDPEEVMRAWKIISNVLCTEAQEQKPLKNETIIDVECEVKDINPTLIERRKDEEV